MQRSDITTGYLGALGLQTRKPDLAFLSEITRRHLAQFAFSSIGPMLGNDLPLDIEALYQRIVVKRRGGYCFEQNGLLYEILQELGYTVSLYLGRVIYNQDIHPGLTHRITLVEIDGNRYVVDVGFGPLGPARPVSLAGDETRENNRVFRIAKRLPNEFHMQTLKDGDFFSLYKFELVHYGPADCELGHFYSHKHPRANFVNNLVVSSIRDHEVRSLRNREFWVMTGTGDQKQLIENHEQLKNLLETRFGLDVSSDESEQIFAKISEK
jgi:N-hydroxyarylamine O-acetyltransferase